MRKLKNYFAKNVFRAKVLLAIFVLMLASAPAIYAQFARQDGDAGWGYGYGYGYGVGYGFDGGTVAGYRTGGDNLDQYGYGYGYGYLPDGVTYDEETGFTVGIEDMPLLVQAGIMVPDGADIEDTTMVTFTSDVTLDLGDGNSTVTIPSGTTFTAGDAADFSALTAEYGVGSTYGLDDFANIGSGIVFGIPDLDLTVDPAITIDMYVGTTYNDEVLDVYRRDAAGWNTTPVTTCTVTAGFCSFTTTHLSGFISGTDADEVPSGGTGTGGGSGYLPLVTPTVPGTTPTVPGATVVSDLDVNAVMRAERALVTTVNRVLTARLAGRILLQVEQNGQAWYLEPVSLERWFMGRPTDAFSLMRRFGLGISNANYDKFAKYGVPAKFAGRIFLQVEKNGEAYYVNPVNMKMYYLGRPADAFRIMRELSLGITNANIRQIPVAKVD